MPFCGLHSAFALLFFKIFLHHLLDFIPLDFPANACAISPQLKMMPIPAKIPKKRLRNLCVESFDAPVKPISVMPLQRIFYNTEVCFCRIIPYAPCGSRNHIVHCRGLSCLAAQRRCRTYCRIHGRRLSRKSSSALRSQAVRNTSHRGIAEH